MIKIQVNCPKCRKKITLIANAHLTCWGREHALYATFGRWDDSREELIAVKNDQRRVKAV